MKTFFDFLWRLAVLALLAALLFEIVRVNSALERAEANSPFTPRDQLDALLSPKPPLKVEVVNPDLDVTVTNPSLEVVVGR